MLSFPATLSSPCSAIYESSCTTDHRNKTASPVYATTHQNSHFVHTETMEHINTVHTDRTHKHRRHTQSTPIQTTLRPYYHRTQQHRTLAQITLPQNTAHEQRAHTGGECSLDLYRQGYLLHKSLLTKGQAGGY